MKTSSNPASQISWIILSSLAVACLGLAAYVFILRSDLAALRTQPAAGQAARPATQQGDEAARNQLPARQNVAQPETEPDRPTPVAATTARQPFGAFTPVFATPEMRQMVHRDALRDARKGFAGLLKKWNLPPDQADQFLQFVADRNSAASSEVFALLGTGKLDANSVPDQKKMRQEHDARLKAWLGDERYAEFIAAEARGAQLKAISQYRDHFEAAGTPLTDDQSAALAQIVIREKPDEYAVLPEDVEFLTQGMTDAQFLKLRQRKEATHTRISQQAASFLSPDQIAALQAAFRSELDGEEVAMKMTRTIFENVTK